MDGDEMTCIWAFIKDKLILLRLYLDIDLAVLLIWHGKLDALMTRDHH
jgi:hypothetical protein